MVNTDLLPATVLRRKAVVYVRQPEQIARVAPSARTRSQCFQLLNEVGHYEQVIAMGRIWFSTQLLPGMLVARLRILRVALRLWRSNLRRPG
jgi:hypothetical protein